MHRPRILLLQRQRLRKLTTISILNGCRELPEMATSLAIARHEHNAKSIVHRLFEPLFASDVSFRRLHGSMPQQELNLLKFPARPMAQPRAAAPQIVRRQIRDPRLFRASLHDVPHGLRRYAGAHWNAAFQHTAEDGAFADPRFTEPAINQAFAPVRNRDRPQP